MEAPNRLDTTLYRIARSFWPDLEDLVLARQLVGVGDVFTTLYASLVTAVGLIWLWRWTDSAALRQDWPILVLIAVLIVIFNQLSFFMIIEFRADRYGSADGAFNSMMVWAGAFIFGANALWLIVILRLVQFLWNWRTFSSPAAKWDNARNLVLTLSGFTIPYLVGLSVFQALGGRIPLNDLSLQSIIVGLIAILVNFFTFALIWLPYYLYSVRTQQRLTGEKDTRPLLTFFFLALALPTIAHPFAILAAGLYTQNGIFVFLYFVIGLVVVAYLARRFSWIAESNRQQSRQLERLEKLGRALLNAPPNASTLPDLLAEHLPNMFPAGNMSIWINPGQTLYHSPEDWDLDYLPIWNFVSGITETVAFRANESLPWVPDLEQHRPAICTPILSEDGLEVIGGIYLELRRLAQPWDTAALARLFPGLHAIADQISSTIHQAEEYAQTIALQKVGQEIRLAGQIQASFLPNEFPNIPGWQLAVSLEPAGGLSGDFFDFIPLSRGRLGIVIADVADKGLGAALYMALCRTLLRTYALEYHSRPDIVFSETNERVINDARASLFITSFYGVLDPVEGTLTYCNAGHNPPYLIRSDDTQEPIALTRTGIPIGIEVVSRWERTTVKFEPGDSLILYTDGVTDAQNENGEFFEDFRLLNACVQMRGSSAFEIQTHILDQIHSFSGGIQQFDDITLMTLSREWEEKSPPNEAGEEPSEE